MIIPGVDYITSNAFAQTDTSVSAPAGTSVPGCEETNECYIPYEVTVDAGGEVTWTNDDSAAHTVTAGNASDGLSGEFDSGLFMAGATFTHKFETVGTYDYFCMVHPWMVGVVMVQEAGTEEMVESTTEVSEEMVESTTEVSEEMVESTTEVSEEMVESTTEVSEEMVESTTEVSEEMVESTTEVSEEMVESTTEVSEEMVESTTEVSEEMVESTTEVSEEMVESTTEVSEEMVESTTEGITVNEGGGGCLIATAAYGTELAPQVQFLREIRDNTVMSTASGASFITGFNQFYYSFSPSIADIERENPMFQETVRIFITPMISTLSIMTLAEEGSEIEVLGLGISVIALNLGMYVVAPTFAGFAISKKLKSRKN